MDLIWNLVERLYEIKNVNCSEHKSQSYVNIFFEMCIINIKSKFSFKNYHLQKVHESPKFEKIGTQVN